jgi:hypothetical protein
VRGFAPVEHRPGQPRFILVTQCLQNDFFWNPECRLGLPKLVVREMLLGKHQIEKEKPASGDNEFSRGNLGRGPLGRFFDETIGRRLGGRESGGALHVVNIRDWHEPGPSYDDERRVYGCHCEAGSWGAAYVDGLAHYLDPGRSPRDEKARYFAAGSVRIYHVHSDTLFDFKPQSEIVGPHKFSSSPLEDLLDVIVEGSDRELVLLHELLDAGTDLDSTTFDDFARRVVASDEGERPQIHLGAIGVYTDIKIKTLLTGVRTRYDLTNVAVSDTFTASMTIERHLAGLDYAKKVLGIEVIHGINDFVRFLGGSNRIEDEKKLVAAERYASYQFFFQDQQNVLAYQSQRLQEYLALTERRALRVYDMVNLANLFLIAFGALFLVATLGFAIAAAIWPDTVRWELPAITGGLSLAQFVGVFFRTPTNDLQQNLTNLARFKLALESHSLKTAIIRFHLTTARTLRAMETKSHAKEALLQIETLRKQLEVIRGADLFDYIGSVEPELDGKREKPKPTDGKVDGEAAAATVKDAASPAEGR